MIVTCTSHGRTAADARRLAAHLAKKQGQAVSVAGMSGLTPGLSLPEALTDLRRTIAQSRRATIGFHHVTINPAVAWTDGQRDEAVRRILAELRATDHSWVLIEHSEKARAMAGGASTHWHLVLAHVGPDGRALDMSHSYARLEAVARTCEADFGEPLTAMRRVGAVAQHLTRMGRTDVATLIKTGAAERPRSAMTSNGRQRADRLGLNLPKIRAQVRAAWNAPDFLAYLDTAGLRLALGERRGVVAVTTASGQFIGALDRLARVSRRDALTRLETELAKRKNERSPRNGQRIEQPSPDDRRSRTHRMARRNSDQINGGGDPRPAESVPGIAGPRLFGADRSEAGLDIGSADAARRRRLALIELRRAEVAGRLRAKRGQRVQDDVLAVKSRLWARIVGEDISPEVAAAILYVDVAARLAKIIGGGWVRDAGDILFASAQAKGWTAVRIWGDEAFIAEARRQFEEAGIPVVVDDAPPTAARPEPPPAPARRSQSNEIRAHFDRKREAAQQQLNDLCKEPPPPQGLGDAIEAEQAAIKAQRLARARADKARADLEAADRGLAECGFLQRRAARQARDDAASTLESARTELFRADVAIQAANGHARELKRQHNAKLRRYRDETSKVWQAAVRERDFAYECAATLEQAPGLADSGVEAVERVTAARLEREQREASRDRASEPPEAPAPPWAAP